MVCLDQSFFQILESAANLYNCVKALIYIPQGGRMLQFITNFLMNEKFVAKRAIFCKMSSNFMYLKRIKNPEIVYSPSNKDH